MTKLVKDYIANKIQEGARPRIDKLSAELAKILATTPKGDVLYAEIEKSKEFKAAEEMVKRIAKNHGATPCTYGKGYKLLDVRHIHFDFEAEKKARKALEDYRNRVSNAITEALVSLELAKTKVDVELLISQAIASLK